MRGSTWSRVVTLGSVSVLGAAYAIVSQGCSSSGSNATTPPAQSVGVTCSNPTLTVAFDPAYSTYIPNSTHTFQIPFGILELTPADNPNVKWTVSDPSKLAIVNGSVDFGSGPAYASAMGTTQGVGDVIVVATNGSTECGATTLHISQASDDDWMIGSARYNMGTLLQRVSSGQLAYLDGGTQAACTNCHGATATMGSYATVEHTPEQTGGFSDSDLIGIFTMGVVPPGGYFDSSIVRQTTWSRFHQWGMTPDQAQGVVVYLRSLTPAPQAGMANLPPRNYGDGGRGGGSSGGSGSSSGSPTTQPDSSPGDDASTGADATMSSDGSPESGTD